MKRRVKMVGLLVLALALVPVVGGCAQRHLHPRFGRASDSLWNKQAGQGRVDPRTQLTGEEVEIVMTNHKRRSTVSEVKNQGGGGALGLLPLQR
jgi:hypothetical protein